MYIIKRTKDFERSFKKLKQAGLSKNKRNIVADENLKKVFGGKSVVNMFEMTKLVSKHLS